MVIGQHFTLKPGECQTGNETFLSGGRRKISSTVPSCRMNAAFQGEADRRIHAAAKNFVVRLSVELATAWSFVPGEAPASPVVKVQDMNGSEDQIL